MSDEGAARVQSWRRMLDIIVQLGVPKEKVVFDPTIARGLEYYTSTVFEFGLVGVEGYGSIAGGGRYNNLLSTFSDKTLPAVGGSLGIDRLYQYLEAEDKLPKGSGVGVVVVNLGQATWDDAVRLTGTLRQGAINTDLYYDVVKLEKQFKYAESKGAKYAVILGDAEKEKGTVLVKDLATRTQEEMAETDLVAYVQTKMK